MSFPLLEEYPSWDAFNVAVKELEMKYYHPIRKRSTTSIENYNKRVRNKKSLRPEFIAIHEMVYCCTHGVKKRLRGTGKRVFHNYRDIGCPFKFKAVAMDGEFPGTYRVVIRNQNFIHTHAIGPDMHSKLVENRMSEYMSSISDSMSDAVDVLALKNAGASGVTASNAALKSETTMPKTRKQQWKCMQTEVNQMAKNWSNEDFDLFMNTTNAMMLVLNQNELADEFKQPLRSMVRDILNAQRKRLDHLEKANSVII